MLAQPLGWAAAPMRGNNALSEEVLHDVFDFLSRQGVPLQGDLLDGKGYGRRGLLKEVQPVTQLRLPKSIVKLGEQEYHIIIVIYIVGTI